MGHGEASEKQELDEKTKKAIEQHKEDMKAAEVRFHSIYFFDF